MGRVRKIGKSTTSSDSKVFGNSSSAMKDATRKCMKATTTQKVQRNDAKTQNKEEAYISSETTFRGATMRSSRIQPVVCYFEPELENTDYIQKVEPCALTSHTKTYNVRNVQKKKIWKETFNKDPKFGKEKSQTTRDRSTTEVHKSHVRPNLVKRKRLSTSNRKEQVVLTQDAPGRKKSTKKGTSYQNIPNTQRCDGDGLNKSNALTWEQFKSTYFSHNPGLITDEQEISSEVCYMLRPRSSTLESAIPKAVQVHREAYYDEVTQSKSLGGMPLMKRSTPTAAAGSARAMAAASNTVSTPYDTSPNTGKTRSLNQSSLHSVTKEKCARAIPSRKGKSAINPSKGKSLDSQRQGGKKNKKKKEIDLGDKVKGKRCLTQNNDEADLSNDTTIMRPKRRHNMTQKMKKVLKTL